MSEITECPDCDGEGGHVDCECGAGPGPGCVCEAEECDTCEGTGEVQ